MITMNTKCLMAGMWLAIMILTATGAALDAPFNAAFSTVYGQVTDSGAGVDGVYVSLAANGVTITTVTMANNRGEHGYYIFELANIPRLTDSTPLTLSVTSGTKTVTTTITKGGGNLQKVDLAVRANVLTALIANITDFNAGDGVRAGAIKANVTVKNMDSVNHTFAVVVSGVSARGYPLAGTGVVVNLPSGQSIRIPVQVIVHPSADLGGYTLFAGVFQFDNEILDPVRLIGNLAGPGIATVR